MTNFSGWIGTLTPGHLEKPGFGQHIWTPEANLNPKPSTLNPVKGHGIEAVLDLLPAHLLPVRGRHGGGHPLSRLLGG